MSHSLFTLRQNLSSWGRSITLNLYKAFLGRTPLSLTAEGHQAVVKLLLDRGDSR